jgi:type I restriction enzyme S subunit
LTPCVRVGDVVRVRHGGTPSKSNSAFWIGDIPWVSPKDFSGANLRAPLDFISEEAISSSAASVVPAGTILAVARSGVLAHSFPVALADRPLSFNQDIKALIPDQRKVDPRFLHHFLRSAERDIVHRGVKRGATVHSLQAGFLEGMSLPLPPLEEQRRIVDILDRAASIRALRRQAQETARQIVPALFNEMFGDPGTNPMRWPTVQMQSLFREKPRYGTMAPATAEPKDYVCLRVANIQDNRLSLESMKFVSGDAINEQRHLVEDGDLLIARAIASRDLLGKCFVAYPGNRKWAFDSHVMMCRFDNALVDPEYVSSFLKSPSGRREFLSHTRNSAIQFNINSKEFSAITLPLPPTALQAQFVGRAKEIMHIAERQNDADAVAEFASQSIHARLFSG